MPGYLDPLTFPTLPVPAIWVPPAPGELAPEEALSFADRKVEASLLRAADPVEAMLRILFNDLEAGRIHTPPEGYDPDLQGEWDPDHPTYAFRRSVRILHEERDQDALTLEYRMESQGFFRVQITETDFRIERMDASERSEGF